MHPAIAVVLIGGGAVAAAFAIWGGYELFTTWHEQYRERREYEEFVRSTYAQYEGRNQRTDNEFEFEDDEKDKNNKKEDDDDSDRNTLRAYPTSNDQYELRNRRGHTFDFDQDQYELTELEKSLDEKRRRLMAEQAYLDREEEILRKRREALQVNKEDTNTSMSSTMTEAEYGSTFNPFMDSHESDDSISHHFENNMNLASHSDDEDKQEQQNDNHQETSSNSLYHSLSSYAEPHELRFPAPSTTTENHSVTTNSTVQSARGLSDTEESWDAVSERDWSRSVDGSDVDHPFSDSHSIKSLSDEEHRYD